MNSLTNIFLCPPSLISLSLLFPIFVLKILCAVLVMIQRNFSSVSVDLFPASSSALSPHHKKKLEKRAFVLATHLVRPLVGFDLNRTFSFIMINDFLTISSISHSSVFVIHFQSSSLPSLTYLQRQSHSKWKTTGEKPRGG